MLIVPSQLSKTTQRFLESMKNNKLKILLITEWTNDCNSSLFANLCWHNINDLFIYCSVIWFSCRHLSSSYGNKPHCCVCYMNCSLFKNISSMADKARCSLKFAQKTALNIYNDLLFVVFCCWQNSYLKMKHLF